MPGRTLADLRYDACRDAVRRVKAMLNPNGIRNPGGMGISIE
jgi:hypothetical protein